jgi:hypothetical protein
MEDIHPKITFLGFAIILSSNKPPRESMQNSGIANLVIEELRWGEASKFKERHAGYLDMLVAQ